MSWYLSSIGSDLTWRLDWNADGRGSEGRGAAEEWPDRCTEKTFDQTPQRIGNDKDCAYRYGVAYLPWVLASPSG